MLSSPSVMRTFARFGSPTRIPTTTLSYGTTFTKRPLGMGISPATQSTSMGALQGSLARYCFSKTNQRTMYCHNSYTVQQSFSTKSSTDESSSSSSSSSTDIDTGGRPAAVVPVADKKLIYKAPMGALVTRLKRISITSCLISIIGLPALIYLKNGTWPDMKQLGMGGFAIVSATGTTLALHFVFGPYVLELHEIPVRHCHSSTTSTDSDPVVCQAAQEFLLQATTRSIMGWKREVVFDPLTDVTTYAGARPFANFVAKKEFILYCHPELLDKHTRRTLLNPKNDADDDDDDDDEGRRNDEKKKAEGSRRPPDEDDGFL